MKILNENLKKAGYFNTLLILIAIILRLMTFSSVPTIVKVDSIVCIMALISGLLYSFGGYKKRCS